MDSSPTADDTGRTDDTADIFDAFREKATEILDVEAHQASPDALLNETLHADSVDLIEIAGLLERQFGVELDDRELYDLETVQDFVDLVARKRR